MLNPDAALNTLLIFVTAPVFQLPIFSLKLLALLNILLIFVTAPVFHAVPFVLMGRLNEPAVANIADIFVTCDVFQLPIGSLKAIALLNILPILVTALVFQLFPFVFIFWLNARAPPNIRNIFVTLLVSQLPMG